MFPSLLDRGYRNTVSERVRPMSSIDITSRPHGSGLFPSRGTILAGLVLLAALVALAITAQPVPDARAPDSAYASPQLIEDWHGNSASIRPAQQ